MNRQELNQRISVLAHELGNLTSVKTNCDTCEKFGRNGHCSQFNETVPEDVQKVGCDQWDWSGIPF